MLSIIALRRRRFAIAYSDTAAIAKHGDVSSALANDELRQQVVDWKNRFFPSGWAHYESARPGSFHLVPPDFRLAELERDYRSMQPMFLREPPEFASVLSVLSDVERKINQNL